MSAAVAFLIPAVVLAAVSNLLLRHGMRPLAERVEGQGPSLVGTALHALRSWAVWTGTLGYAAAMACWLQVLGRTEIGLVYPAFTGGGTICIMALSVLVLREKLEKRRILGAALMIGGIFLAALE